MRKVKLTRQETMIEEALVKGEYKTVSGAEFKSIAQAVAARKKDAVLNLRVNSQDLRNIKQKARKLGVKYQSFISEIIHRVAES